VFNGFSWDYVANFIAAVGVLTAEGRIPYQPIPERSAGLGERDKTRVRAESPARCESLEIPLMEWLRAFSPWFSKATATQPCAALRAGLV
jgi:hypothetical protein